MTSYSEGELVDVTKTAKNEVINAAFIVTIDETGKEFTVKYVLDRRIAKIQYDRIRPSTTFATTRRRRNNEDVQQPSLLAPIRYAIMILIRI